LWHLEGAMSQFVNPKDFDDFGIFDILNDVDKEIAKREDEAIFTAFEKYGYSKDYLVSHANEFCTEYWPSCGSKTFYHYDEKLFTIYEITDFNRSSMYSFMYQLDFYVVYHKKI
jgi:hypothetical protein